MTSNGNGSLHVLGDRGRTVDGAANDVRGREVRDSHGDHIGTVADLVDQSRDRVASAPGYQPDLVADRAHQARILHRYGRTPYREPRYTYPANLGVLSLSASRMRS